MKRANYSGGLIAGLVVAGLVMVGVLGRRRETGPGQYEPGPDVTLSPAQVDFIASEFYVSMWGVGGWQPTEDEARASGLLAMASTDDDLLSIAKAYGCRAPSFSIGCLTLWETVARFFSQGQRDRLNERLAARGVTLQF